MCGISAYICSKYLIRSVSVVNPDTRTVYWMKRSVADKYTENGAIEKNQGSCGIRDHGLISDHGFKDHGFRDHGFRDHGLISDHGLKYALMA